MSESKSADGAAAGGPRIETVEIDKAALQPYLENPMKIVSERMPNTSVADGAAAGARGLRTYWVNCPLCWSRPVGTAACGGCNELGQRAVYLAADVARLKAQKDRYYQEICTERGRIAELEARLHAVEADRWQPIETAPKDGTWIQVWADSCERSIQTQWVRWQGEERWVGTMSPLYVTPTHWMPLPSPPLADRAAPLAAPAQETK